MDTYAVIEVGERQGAVWLSSTLRQAAEEILTELQRLCPTWRVRPRRAYSSEAGDVSGWSVDRCGGRHRYAMWWLMRQLCSRGWEPFAVAHEPSREAWAAPLYLFRKRSGREA